VTRCHGQQNGYLYDPPGNLTSVSATGPTAPSITTQPQPQLIESNAEVTLSVVATGAGLTYQWLSNGVPIIGATGDSLVLTNVPLVNSTNFRVVVSNASGVVTSSPVALWADSNGNGIPDWWEMQYFGNLNQTAAGDYDGDGVDNLDEYLEGTNPTNAASYDPRLYIQTVYGRVVASPDQPYYKMGQIVELTAIPDAAEEFLGWSGSVTGSKPAIAVVMNSHQYITATFGLPLGVALDNTNLAWTTGGAVPWFGQVEVSEDGVSSAQSGSIWSSQQSWLQTTVSLEQTEQLSFWWDVSSQPPDGLSFSLDGTVLASISGTSTGWNQIQTNLTSGNHTLLWSYSKAGGNSITGVPYVDAGWVDQVSLAPLITQSGAPPLNIQLIDTNTALISWPAPSTGFVLEQCPTVDATNWVTVTNAVNVVGSQNQVEVIPAATAQFYRLKN
jgi:hypothetical protein